jgi:prevent-host-death family protein
MSEIVSLADAKTQLSRLIDRAAQGEEIVIAKNGVPLAKLVPVPLHGRKRRPAKAMGITFIADDFDAL